MRIPTEKLTEEEAAAARNEQVLVMQSERVGVPELLFHPADVGLLQGGLHNAVVSAVGATSHEMHSTLSVPPRAWQ